MEFFRYLINLGKAPISRTTFILLVSIELISVKIVNRKPNNVTDTDIALFDKSITNSESLSLNTLKKIIKNIKNNEISIGYDFSKWYRIFI
jgi:hypothetical protein